MEENKEMLELLRKIREESAGQLRLSRIRCVFSGISAVCFIVAVVLLLSLMPKVNGILEQADAIITQVDGAVAQLGGVMGQMETVLSNLEQTTEQLAKMDLEAMVSNVDTLVTTAQGSLEQTMEKLDTIDFEALNKAIKDLAAGIEPLAKIANIFP